MKSVEKNPKITIRTLTVADRKRFSKLIEQLTERVGDDSVLNMISSAQSSPANGTDKGKAKNKSEDSLIKVGIKILQSLLGVLEDETHSWFAELIGVSKEEFLNLPIDTEVVIIKQMVESRESTNFFTIASGLYKKIEGLRNRFTGAKD